MSPRLPLTCMCQKEQDVCESVLQRQSLKDRHTLTVWSLVTPPQCDCGHFNSAPKIQAGSEISQSLWKNYVVLEVLCKKTNLSFWIISGLCVCIKTSGFTKPQNTLKNPNMTTIVSEPTSSVKCTEWFLSRLNKRRELCHDILLSWKHKSKMLAKIPFRQSTLYIYKSFTSWNISESLLNPFLSTLI